MRDLSISVVHVRRILTNAVEQGLDPLVLLRRNRISPRLLLEDSAMISIERFADLQVNTMLAMEDEALGFCERKLPIGAWSMMCHAVLGSETLGQALNRYCRFWGLFELCGLSTQIETDDEQVRFVLIERAERPQTADYFFEVNLFNLHRFASWLTHCHLPLQRVDLAHSPLATPRDYRRMFKGSPVQFNQPVTQLVFPVSIMEKPVVQNEPGLRRFLRHPVLAMLTQDYRHSTWTYKVKELLRHDLAKMPELSDLAEKLAIHPQTLRRRLADENTSYKEIKQQLRRDTALHFLGKQGLSIEEIAYRAGFSESSAFIRAFKGWTGVTPYTYRKGL